MSAQADDKQPVWPGPRLIVPMAVDCLLVGTPDRTKQTWAVTRTNYFNLARALTPTAAPPFLNKSGEDELPPTGAYVAWTLPNALRQGAAPTQPGEGEAGDVNFRLVPNRWLILRTINHPVTGDTVATPDLEASVLQSDALKAMTGAPTAVESMYPDPQNNYVTDVIGQVYSLENWDGPAGPATPFLKSSGPGNVTWIAAYDNVQNVLTLYDSLEGVDPNTVTYTAIGWYADPATDPLYTIPTSDTATWRDTLATQFGWSLGANAADVTDAIAAWKVWAKSHGLDGGGISPDLPAQMVAAQQAWLDWQKLYGDTGSEPDLPRQMLVQGMIAQIVWQGGDAEYGTGAPDQGKSPPSVAIGNTSAEAVAAWLATTLIEQQQGDPSTIPLIEEAIEAFQAGLLNDLESKPGDVAETLHSLEFGQTGLRGVWTVVQQEAQESAAAGTDASANPQVPLNPEQTDALTALNASQANADDITSRLESLQGELYALAWKEFHLPRNAPQDIKDKVTGSITAITSAVTDTQKALETAQDQIKTDGAALKKLLDEDVYQIRFASTSPAAVPNDPIVLIAGAKGETKFAQPGTYSDKGIDENGNLICRITGQSVIGLDLDGLMAGAASLNTADILSSDGGVTLPTGAPIPKEVPDLWVEQFFLDTGAAPYLAFRSLSIGGGEISGDTLTALSNTIQGLQMAPWTALEADEIGIQAAAQAVGLIGVLPSHQGVTFRSGQPWTPVALDWMIRWGPSGTSLDTMLDDWEYGDIDYIWTGGQVTIPDDAFEYEAQSPLSTQVAQSIGALLERYKADPSLYNLPIVVQNALIDMVALFKDADIYTQSMTGLTQQLLTRMVGPAQFKIDSETAALIGPSPHGFVPMPGDLAAQTDQPFYPLRAGHYQLMELRVVDFWGQVLSGKAPGVPPAAPVPNVIRSQSATTPPYPPNVQPNSKDDLNRGFAELRPRISDATNLTFDLLSAGSDTVISNSSVLTSSIAGYVIPNNLDVSLAVYDAEGNASGSVIMVQTDAQNGQSAPTGLRWDLAPGSSAPLGSPPALANSHMQNMTQGLLNAGLLYGGQALDDLFDHIDTALWAKAPLGYVSYGVSTLLGPPLAVVRARLSASIYGFPEYNQTWRLTGEYYLGENNTFDPRPTPIQSVKMQVRLGDTELVENGVMGFFVNDDYSLFHAVYGAGGQTGAVRRALRSAPQPLGSLSALLGVETDSDAGGDDGSGYVDVGHLIDLPLDGTPVYLTILLDPRGRMPVTSGWQPQQIVGLPAGAVTTALNNIVASFRAGPVLVDPQSISMPLPSEVRGNWAWAARTDVTSWAPDQPVTAANTVADLNRTPPVLSEGWLTLSGAFKEE